MTTRKGKLCRRLCDGVALGAMLALSAQAAAAPERIVSADGALTEIVHALGEGERLVGVDTTSQYPGEVTELPQIGYKRALSVEGVLSLNPDLLLMTDDAGPDTAVRQLNGSGLEMMTFVAEPTLESVKGKVVGVAELLDKPEAGQALWESIKADVEAARVSSDSLDDPVRVLFVLGLDDRSPLVAGASTEAETMIALAGGVNVIDSFEGYKPISPEAVAMTGADVVLMMEREEHATSAGALFAKPGFAALPAAEDKRLVKQKGTFLLGFGPRIGEAVAWLNGALYPAESSDAR
ncbi:MAG TPA: ABC transporter substrate-binding protein [Halomonas sp.]|nr:ABC transporter substrate-binding protein [Halomonas sp.]